MPTKIEKTTICKISLLAMASTMDLGTRWVMKSLRDRVVASTELAAVTSGRGMFRPTPGEISWTIISPMDRETTEAVMNQPMVLAPTRPMAAASSIWAIPTTRVEKTRGAMIILIRRRKMSVTTLKPPATALT